MLNIRDKLRGSQCQCCLGEAFSKFWSKANSLDLLSVVFTRWQTSLFSMQGTIFYVWWGNCCIHRPYALSPISPAVSISISRNSYNGFTSPNRMPDSRRFSLISCSRGGTEHNVIPALREFLCSSFDLSFKRFDEISFAGVVVQQSTWHASFNRRLSSRIFKSSCVVKSDVPPYIYLDRPWLPSRGSLDLIYLVSRFGKMTDLFVFHTRQFLLCMVSVLLHPQILQCFVPDFAGCEYLHLAKQLDWPCVSQPYAW